ncbi:sensor histidine kinase [Pseudoduganella aquatica]|uniref:Sensor protein FixL n=1 Tax=Pseudoduganella aquatica TaxID=2660641 RepID=A0A7X4KMY8_9BURK|nr:PAS domain-containing sensor histidine kinase [Pseudoduganella aquatica]MYN08638.1 PAS domain S-box protein [Pseudoduganella aquatica]
MQNPPIADQSLAWLLAAATDPVLIVDRGGAIALANPALEALFGYTQEQLQGLPVETLIPERFRHGHQALREGYTAEPHPRAMGAGAQLSGRHREGREFPVEVSLSPLRSPDGQTMVMATIHDISARKAAEQALQESEARMRAVFETAVDGIITIDEHGMLERLNPAAERMFGYREAEVAGRNINMLMPEPHRSAHDGYLAHYRATGEKRIIGKGREVQGLRRDGSVFPMDLSVAEMTLGGKRMYTGLVRDITERKLAEQKSEQLLQELSSANEELTNFAYVVSHDLKAPLRGIGSLADWLATDYAALFNDEGKEHMRLLINRVHRMGALIDGILQYSRVGRVREAVVLVDLNKVLAEVLDLLAPPPGIAITVAPGLPTVAGEPTRLQQVFHNLISNAIKYMHRPDGQVTVSCEDDGSHWRFAVTDNGPGIEPRHFERIFQLFQTLAPRDRVESTGVGLALVKKIVEMYRGRVWVESAPGAGATFYFTWPKECL